jgi:hypothetical protein
LLAGVLLGQPKLSQSATRITSWRGLQVLQVLLRVQELHQQAFVQQRERERVPEQVQRLALSCRRQQRPGPGSWQREVTSAFLVSLKV